MYKNSNKSSQNKNIQKVKQLIATFSALYSSTLVIKLLKVVAIKLFYAKILTVTL